MMPPPFASLSRRGLILAAGGALWLSSGLIAARAQDRISLKDNSVVTGKVVGVSNGAIVMNVATSSGTGQMSYNLALVSRLEVPAPASYQSGMAAYQAASWDKALAELKPLADAFHGLPTEWAKQATSVLGDIYIEKNELSKAEAAFNDYRRYYPEGAGSSLRLSLSQARIAYAKNNAPQAKQQLQPLTQAALKNPAVVTRLDGALYGQAFYLLGQIQEKEGSYRDALENYLRTVTLFYQDGAVTAKAQQSADALRAAHKDVAAP